MINNIIAQIEKDKPLFMLSVLFIGLCFVVFFMIEFVGTKKYSLETQLKSADEKIKLYQTRINNFAYYLGAAEKIYQKILLRESEDQTQLVDMLLGLLGGLEKNYYLRVKDLHVEPLKSEKIYSVANKQIELLNIQLSLSFYTISDEIVYRVMDEILNSVQGSSKINLSISKSKDVLTDFISGVTSNMPATDLISTYVKFDWCVVNVRDHVER